MTALEYILDGLEAELSLERELGVRVVECDRSLLGANEESGRDKARPSPLPDPNTQTTQTPTNPKISPPPGPNTQTPKHSNTLPPLDSNTQTPKHSNTSPFPFLFLHHAPLSAAGVEMVAKITAALGATASSAPLVVAPPLPAARVYVVLGGLALKRWFPGKNAAPGQWLAADGGAQILVTYSPEYILRFKTVTPTMKKMKFDMWNSLKEMQRRLRS